MDVFSILRTGFDFTRRQHGRFSSRAVGFHEGAEEVLTLANYCGTGVAGLSDRAYTRVSRGAFYLHVVLEMVVRDRWQVPSHLSRADSALC